MSAPAFRIGDVVRLDGMPDAAQCVGVVAGTGWVTCERDRTWERRGDLRPVLLVRLARCGTQHSHAWRRTDRGALVCGHCDGVPEARIESWKRAERGPRALPTVPLFPDLEPPAPCRQEELDV